MNTTDNPKHIDPAGPDPARLVPDEPRDRPEPVEATFRTLSGYVDRLEEILKQRQN